MNEPLEIIGSPQAAARRRRPLRRRLVVALVGISTGSLLLAGLLTVTFARQAARAAAVNEIRRSLASVAEGERSGEQLVTLARLEELLRLDGIGLVVVTGGERVSTLGTGPLGRRFPGRPFDRRNVDLDAARAAAEAGSRGRLPDGVEDADLDLAALLAGEVDTGRRGSVVFVAQPLAPKTAGVPVVVATRGVGLFDGLPGALTAAAGAAALAAAAVAPALVRRLTAA